MQFIVRKDFLMRPTFSKLKTLLLNVSDADAGFGPLVYILRNSPVLEKLTLQLYEVKEIVFFDIKTSCLLKLFL